MPNELYHNNNVIIIMWSSVWFFSNTNYEITRKVALKNPRIPRISVSCKITDTKFGHRSTPMNIFPKRQLKAVLVKWVWWIIYVFFLNKFNGKLIFWIMYVFYIIYKWTLRGNILLCTILQFLNYQFEKSYYRQWRRRIFFNNHYKYLSLQLLLPHFIKCITFFIIFICTCSLT